MRSAYPRFPVAYGHAEDRRHPNKGAARVSTCSIAAAGKTGGDGWESNPPRRLNSAPQTVLKTAGLESAAIHHRLHKFSLRRSLSVIVRHRPPQSADLAVFLAVSRPPPLRQGLLITRFRVRLPAREPAGKSPTRVYLPTPFVLTWGRAATDAICAQR